MNTRITDNMSRPSSAQLRCHHLLQQQPTKAPLGEAEATVTENQTVMIGIVPTEEVAAPMVAEIRILVRFDWRIVHSANLSRLHFLAFFIFFLLGTRTYLEHSSGIFFLDSFSNHGSIPLIYCHSTVCSRHRAAQTSALVPSLKV
jgi:hypothetical protein